MLRQIRELIGRQHYVQAFAAIRLMAGLVAGGGLLIAYAIGQSIGDLWWSCALFTILTIVNIVAVWQSSRRRIDDWLIPLALLDTIFIASLLYITGGIASPLELLFLFPIGQVAIGSSAKASVGVALLGAILYTGLLIYPFGVASKGLEEVIHLNHLTEFNVIVSDAAFLAFALAAGQAGRALRFQERRLLDRSSRLRREVGTLARLARTTARETDLAAIVDVILETASLELGIVRSAVLLTEGAAETFQVVAARGFESSGSDRAHVPMAITHGALVQAAVEYRRTLTPHGRYRRRQQAILSHADATPGAAAAPLLVGDSCLGCLYVDAGTRSFHWSEESLLLLEAFADLAAVSVDNARLYNGLIAEKSKLEATMGAVTDALLIYEPGGQVLLANQPFRALFDISPWASALSLKGILKYMDEQRRLGMTETGQEVTDLFDPSALELEIGVPPRLLQRRGKVVFDESGVPLATVLTLHDVTEEHQAERARAEILATVSHELRTPLTSIKGFVQIFERRQRRSEPIASEHELDLVLKQAEHLMSLVDDLLDVSHLPGRHTRLSRSLVDLEELTKERVGVFVHDTGRRISMRTLAKSVRGVWDRRKLVQVIDNLLTNAVKYSESDSEVTVTLRNGHRTVEVAIQDQGVGLAMDHQEHVFDAFYRVDNTTTRRTNGLGIGLYLCKRIIEQHGGEIYVRSKPGAGSEFAFSLPLPSNGLREVAPTVNQDIAPARALAE